MNRKEIYKRIFCEGLNLPKKVLSTPEGWFKDYLSRLTEVLLPSKPNSIFYKHGDDIVMEIYFSNEQDKQDRKNGNLYYDYKKIYLVLQDKFNLDSSSIRAVVKGVAETTLNYRSLTPGCWN